MTFTNITSLVEDYGYTHTVEFNGKSGKKGKQIVKVVEAAKVPANWNGDKSIVAKAIVEGTRGAHYDAHIYANGFISVF